MRPTYQELLDQLFTRKSSGHRDKYQGKCFIDAAQSRSSSAYGYLATPDVVPNIVLPSGGFLVVQYMALWQESILNQALATIVLNGIQLREFKGGAPLLSAVINTAGAVAATDAALTTEVNGLMGGQSATATTLTGTGTVIGTSVSNHRTGGPCYIWADPGKYDIGIRYAALSGSVTAKSRKLWVWTIPF